ncbi:zinc finger protein 91-like [Apis mellifera carnica]|nr:zinc finger protein 91-like [Apis mellifera carnica]
MQKLREAVSLEGFVEQTLEIRVRRGAQVHVFGVREKVSSQADSKRDHNRVNYDAPFTCYKCGKRYTWTDSLTRHLREGCGKLPRHKCTLCGRKFKRRDYLLRHENNVHKAE